MDLCGVGNCHLNLHTRLDVDGGDLLDDLGGRVQVDDTLVDPHLEIVPGLGTLTARSLPGGEGDPNPVDWRLLLNSLSILVCSHDIGRVSDCGQRSPALNLSTSCRSESSNKSLV